MAADLALAQVCAADCVGVRRVAVMLKTAWLKLDVEASTSKVE
jgi:hypothetical protein